MASIFVESIGQVIIATVEFVDLMGMIDGTSNVVEKKHVRNIKRPVL